MRRLARVLLSTLEKGSSSKDTDIVNLVTDGDMCKCKHCDKEAALCPSLRGSTEIPWGLYFPLYVERATSIRKLSRAGSGLIGLRLTTCVS